MKLNPVMVNCAYESEMSMYIERRRIFTNHHHGQSLVIIALILPVLTIMMFGGLMLTQRVHDRMVVEAALQHAARASAHAVQYRGFATDQPTIDATRAQALGRAVLRANLVELSVLDEPVDDLIERVAWTILPRGGSCVLPSGRSITSGSAPLVCVSVSPRLRGMITGAPWMPLLEAAEVMD